MICDCKEAKWAGIILNRMSVLGELRILCPKCNTLWGIHGAAAKKEKNETVADTLQSMDVQGKAVSPSQNSQKCKGCNQDFEGQHRSYCPTQKDRWKSEVMEMMNHMGVAPTTRKVKK